MPADTLDSSVTNKTEDAVAGFSRGLQVEPVAIERELKRLWKEGEGVLTRASLMNLAVYSEETGALEKNSALMAEVTKDHSCRAILIAAHPNAAAPSVQSWISAHCHVGRAGGRHVCCEQIAFLLEGRATGWIPNLVFSHLDSDLPLYFWWQGALPSQIDKQLWSWVNTLVYDSHSWDSKSVQFERLHAIRSTVSGGLVLSDLNWTRQVYLRLATAHFFDHEGGAAQLRAFESLHIAHHPDYLFSALLYAGWLAIQLGWRVESGNCSREHLTFIRADGQPVKVSLTHTDGPIISKIEGRTGGNTAYEIEWAAGAEFLSTIYHGGDTVDLPQAMPAGKQDEASLVIEELRRGGKHRIYARTLRLLEPVIDRLGL